jgi:hypothetical protein
VPCCIPFLPMSCGEGWWGVAPPIERMGERDILKGQPSLALTIPCPIATSAPPTSRCLNLPCPAACRQPQRASGMPQQLPQLGATEGVREQAAELPGNEPRWLRQMQHACCKHVAAVVVRLEERLEEWGRASRRCVGAWGHENQEPFWEEWGRCAWAVPAQKEGATVAGALLLLRLSCCME